MKTTHIVAILLASTLLCGCNLFKKDKEVTEDSEKDKVKAVFKEEALNSQYTGSSTTFTIYKNGTVQFTNQSENADSYRWEFGDGATSTEESPKHTFTKCGLYLVELYAYRGEEMSHAGHHIRVTSPNVDVTTRDAYCYKYEYLKNGKLVNGTLYHRAYYVTMKGGFYGYTQASKWGFYLGTTYYYWDATSDQEISQSTIWYTNTALQNDLYLNKYLKLKVKAYAVKPGGQVSGDVFGNELYVRWEAK